MHRDSILALRDAHAVFKHSHLERETSQPEFFNGLIDPNNASKNYRDEMRVFQCDAKNFLDNIDISWLARMEQVKFQVPVNQRSEYMAGKAVIERNVAAKKRLAIP